MGRRECVEARALRSSACSFGGRQAAVSHQGWDSWSTRLPSPWCENRGVKRRGVKRRH
jgi:hypothetical protein